jgi:hypothetical protein
VNNVLVVCEVCDYFEDESDSCSDYDLHSSDSDDDVRDLKFPRSQQSELNSPKVDCGVPCYVWQKN